MRTLRELSVAVHWVLGLALAYPGQTQAIEVLAGAAHRVVTPPLGHMLAGYGRDRAATGVLTDLYAKALILDDGQTRLGLLTLDSIGLTRPDIQAIAGLAAQRLPGFDARHLVLSSTHTHAGPDVVGLWGESLWRSGRDEAYMASLYERAVAALVAADAAKVPVVSRVGSRVQPMPWVENRSEPALLDSTLAVLQLLDAQGNSVATLTNFACHPTVLDGDNTLVSSDYVGSFYTTMAQAIPGEHLFLQGAIGGWVQPLIVTENADRIALAEQYGGGVGQAAIALLEDAEANPLGRLEFRSKTFDVPLDNWGFRLMMWLGVLERETFAGAMRTETAWFRLGQAEFVTHPGETSPAYSLLSRQQLGARHSFVLGLTQDAMGYILKPDYFAEDTTYPHAEYLRSVSAGAGAGPRLMDALEELLLQRESPPAATTP